MCERAFRQACRYSRSASHEKSSSPADMVFSVLSIRSSNHAMIETTASVSPFFISVFSMGIPFGWFRSVQRGFEHEPSVGEIVHADLTSTVGADGLG